MKIVVKVALCAAFAMPLVANSGDGDRSLSDRLVLISNGEEVGYLSSANDGKRVSVEYFVDNNGRGPKLTENLMLDDRGYPLEWTVTGFSLFGAPVDESYRWENGSASWRSQADAGKVASKQARMYIAADASPWSLGMYARALLDEPDFVMNVLPSGRMQLERAGALSVSGGAGHSVDVELYLLKGIGLEPSLIALDSRKRLFASIGDRSSLIRESYVSGLAELEAWSRDYEIDRHRRLKQLLANDFDRPVLYKNVRVFDSWKSRVGQMTSVVVSDGRIKAIGPDAGNNFELEPVVIDGQGGTLVPGLFDMHAHNSLQSGLFYLAAGITSTRDMGNDNQLLTEVLEATEAGELAGPRINRAGLIEARSPYSARIGIVADTEQEALQAVRWYAQHGYAEIKTYNSMNPDWLPGLIAEANRLGMGITGHVPAFLHPDEVIAAGYDSIAHINQLMLGWLLEEGEDTRTALRLTAMKRGANLDLNRPDVRTTVALMREHKTALDTTAVILERLMLSRAGEVAPGDKAYLSHMPIGYQRYRKRTFVPLDEPGDDAAYERGVDKMLDVIRLLYENDVPLLIGTDDTTGFTVHREIELYTMAGIPHGEALSIATLGAARYLGIEEAVGAIAPGLSADFLLVEGDPVADISAIRKVRAVSRGGTVYFPEEIYRALAIKPFATKPPVQVPEL